ncbi:MAG: hypothetical protein Q7U04_05735 [Bacteriovorax sp.]|nr:hypothetical protein [Bacteriovorax sp.]
MIRYFHIVFFIQLFLMSFLQAEEKFNSPKGKIDSPYEACKNVLIVDREKYNDNKQNWDQIEKKCKVKIQLANDIGLTSINPLKEGIQYLSLSQQVVLKVIDNLKKNRTYIQCSADCFAGAATCKPIASSEKIIQCTDRKKETIEAMKVYSRKIKMELALSDDAPGMVNVNINNVLNIDKDKFINTNLRDFESGTPNPIGRVDLGARELKEAQRRSKNDRKKLEEEYKEKGYSNYSKWMAVKLMEKLDEHRARYRELIYEEAPIFSVIDRPIKIESGDDPSWSDDQLSKAFSKLADNTIATQATVQASINNSVVEFSRLNGTALVKFFSSFNSNNKDTNDLLYYIGMKNQVEEVLKKDPSLCATATEMEARLSSKEIQNMGITFVASLPVGGAILKGTTKIFKLTRALGMSEAAGIVGLSLAADSFTKSFTISTEAQTISGLGGDQEGTSLRKSEEVTNALEAAKMSLMFAPLDVAGGWKVGKVLYSALAKKMAKDLPEMGALIKKATLDNVSRDQVVDKWIGLKVKSAFKSGAIDEADQVALKSDKAKEVLETLTAEIEKSNPDFFKNAENMDFFFKTAATTIKKEKGDPADLGVKAKELLLHFNTEAMNGSWDPGAQKSLLKVFDNAIIELRLSAKNDPATYAKFTSNQEAKEKIFASALKRSGADDKDLPAMLTCALPH